MKRAEFDKFAEEYRALHRKNIACTGETPEYFAEYKMKDLRGIVNATPSISETGHFLDFGAGIGSSVSFFRKYFPNAHLTCVDVSKTCLEIAASNSGTLAEYVVFNGICLPFADNSFEAVYASCVFHHIPPTEHVHLLQELKRVLKVNGVIMLYEHNPLNILSVRAVNSCPFDENAILISANTMRAHFKSAGYLLTSVSYRVFFPRLFSFFRWMEHWLTWLPLGAQYYIVASKTPPQKEMDICK